MTAMKNSVVEIFWTWKISQTSLIPVHPSSNIVQWGPPFPRVPIASCECEECEAYTECEVYTVQHLKCSQE